MSAPKKDFFQKDQAQNYDEKNKKLSRISDNLHFLTSLILKDLPAKARILCVGAGTGKEILFLAKEFPEWSFVALEPSSSMLAVCRENLTKEGLSSRCEFVEGYIEDLKHENSFDAALSFLVGHFIKKDQKQNFFQEIVSHLKPGGHFLNAEISFDLASAEFPSMLKNWKEVQKLMGATEESLESLPSVLKEILSVLSPLENEELLKLSGIKIPIKFFQAFMVCGWYGIKE